MKARDLIEITRKELIEKARELGIKGRDRMKKDDLISSIKALLTDAPKGVKKKITGRQENKPSEVLIPHPGMSGPWQERVEDAKFYLGNDDKGSASEEHIPSAYNDNKVVLLVRDPYWAYVYWEINGKKVDEARRELRLTFDSSELIMRVYDITGIDFDGENAHYFFDIKIPNALGDWYVNLGRPNRTFCIDIGYRKPDGGLLVLSRSNKITLPSDTFSDITDEEWASAGDFFEKVFAESGGFRAEGSSAGLAELMKRRLEQQISSFGVVNMKPETKSSGN